MLTKPINSIYTKSMLMAIAYSIVVSNNVCADVVLDGSMGTEGTLSGPNIEITAGMGQLSNGGANLFHSFQTFNLDNTQTANFSGPANVNNIIGRITGGQSVIDGTISSSINGANLFLLNPNGILFGANATVNITGSFHASTADSLHFSDGAVFYTDPTKSVTFTSAAPSSFGFLAANPATIDVAGLKTANSGTDVSLVAGDINFINGSAKATVNVNDGQLMLASVASQGNADFTENDIQTGGFSSLGTISMDNTAISTSGDSGGRVVIRGGNLIMKNSTTIEANSTGVGNVVSRAGIDIEVENSVEMQGSGMVAYAMAGSDGNDIKINSGTLTLNQGSFIKAGTNSGAAGSGGDINITTNNTISPVTLSVTNGSAINTSALGTGDAGDINLDSKSIEISNNSLILADAALYDGVGSAGNISINTEFLHLTNDFEVVDPKKAFNGIVSNTGYGNSGGANVFIEAQDITLDKNSGIYTTNAGTGLNANVAIRVENTFNILNGSQVYMLVEDTYSSGLTAGAVTIDADTLNISGGHEIILGEFFGKVFKMHIKSGVNSKAGYGRNASKINKSSDISLKVNELSLTNGGFIASKSRLGASGDINVTANSIKLSGYYEPQYNYFTNDGITSQKFLKGSYSYISTTILQSPFLETQKTENFGNINLTANTIDVNNLAYIATETLSTGNAGNITIEAQTLNISNGSRVTTSSVALVDLERPGAAGTVIVTANTINIDGEKFLNQTAGILSSSGEFGGAAGSIELIADNINIKNGALIDSSTSSSYNGGSIILSARNELQLSNNVSITTNAFASGNAGNINIYDTGTLMLLEDSKIASMANNSIGGTIAISTKDLVYLKNSSVNTDVTTGEGQGGNVNIVTRMLLMDSADITTTADAGNGGDINIMANSLLQTPDSIIDASSRKSVDGNIDVNVFVDVNSALLNIPETLVNITSLTDNNCRSIDNTQNNFVVRSEKPISWVLNDYTEHEPPGHDIGNTITTEKNQFGLQAHQGFTNNTVGSSSDCIYVLLN